MLGQMLILLGGEAALLPENESSIIPIRQHELLHVQEAQARGTTVLTARDKLQALVREKAHLLAEKLLLAVPGKLSALLAEAVLHPASTGLHTLAQSLDRGEVLVVVRV